MEERRTLQLKNRSVYHQTMTPTEWNEYCEKNGHPPTWMPHERRREDFQNGKALE